MFITTRIASSVSRTLVGLITFVGILHMSIPPANAKELVYAYDFESGTLEGLGYNHAGNGNAPSITSSNVRHGKYAMKSYVNRTTSEYFNRTEATPLISGGVGYHFAYSEDYWVGFSTFLPHDYKESDVWELIAQWHAVNDTNLGEARRPPPLALETSRGIWTIVSRWDSKANTFLNGAAKYGGKMRRDINPVADDKGRWVDWVFHVKFSWKSDGVLQVWKSGELVVDHNGPNAYNDKTPPYFKMGVYLGWPNRQCCANVPTEKAVFHDELRVMRGSDVTYEDMAPPGGTSKSKVAPSPPSPPSPPSISTTE